MNYFNKIIIIFSFIIIGIMIVSSPVSAFWQCGVDVKSCTIIEFDFNKGITPACFHGPENIDMTAGWCDFLQIISNIIGLLYIIIIPIITFMIVAGGILLMTAGGNEGRIKKGTSFLKSAIIGLIIVIAAGVIVGAIIRGLGVVEGTTLMPWL